ncbi:MAG: Smr/MutS family protein, partial [Clostridia bacterium]|nr:Smr/MutS family protein [Clostridia bacterium]
TLPDQKGNLTVLAGIMRIKTNLSRLSRCEAHKKKAERSPYRNASARNKEIRPELDLRGMNLEEAEYVTEKFIDDAVLANIPSVVIIHGKGTGVLRAGIHQLLKKNKSVKSFRLGNFGEGEAGVTICEMK